MGDKGQILDKLVELVLQGTTTLDTGLIGIRDQEDLEKANALAVAYVNGDTDIVAAMLEE